MSSNLTLLAPVVVGAAVAVLAWLAAGNRQDAGSIAKEKACSNCGSLVLDGWRLCPECGGFIDGSSGGDGVPPTGMPASDSNSEHSV